MKFQTFEERFNYLKIGGVVGQTTFGFERYLNQILYQSREWKDIRREVIIRDNCCDLGIEFREIHDCPTAHHINPITIQDIENRARCVLDLDNLICVSPRTHRIVHYGDASQLLKLPTKRTKGDTTPWLMGKV